MIGASHRVWIFRYPLNGCLPIIGDSSKVVLRNLLLVPLSADGMRLDSIREHFLGAVDYENSLSSRFRVWSLRILYHRALSSWTFVTKLTDLISHEFQLKSQVNEKSMIQSCVPFRETCVSRDKTTETHEEMMTTLVITCCMNYFFFFTLWIYWKIRVKMKSKRIV